MIYIYDVTAVVIATLPPLGCVCVYERERERERERETEIKPHKDVCA